MKNIFIIFGLLLIFIPLVHGQQTEVITYYQEFANISGTVTNNTGTYSYNGAYEDSNSSKITDGNWGTFSRAVTATARTFINYTIPNNLIDANWSFRTYQGQYYNNSIPKDCWNLSTNRIDLRIITTTTGTYRTLFYCFNQTNREYQLLSQHGDWNNLGYVWEEGVYWIINVTKEIDNCSIYTQKTLNVSLLNESDDSTIKETINYNFNYINSNFSGSALQNETFCMSPNGTSMLSDVVFDYTVNGIVYEYSADNLNLSDTVQSILLYAQDGTERVTLTVKDTTDNEISDAYINIQKYDIETNTFSTVEIVKTNDEGQAIANLILYSTWYRFSVSYNGVTYLTTESTKVFSTTKTFNIDLTGDDWFADYDITTGITSTLTFNNVSKSFTFTWSDPTSAMHQGCMKVIKRKYGDTTIINETCIESAASSIIQHIGTDIEDASYIATGYFKFDNIILQKVKEIIFEGGKAFYKKVNKQGIGLFTSWMLSMSLMFVGVWSPPVAIILLLVGLIGTSMLQLWQIATPFLWALIIMGALVLFKIGGNNK